MVECFRVTTASAAIPALCRRPRLRRRSSFGLALVLALGFSGVSATLRPAGALAQSADRDAAALETEFVAGVNTLRVSQGLPAFVIDPEIRGVALGWTQKMADAGRISHNPNLAVEVTAPWRKLGENVGTGPDAPTIEEAFENSPGHRRNLLDPEFTHLAITVIVRGERIYVTQQFRTPTAVSPAPADTAGAPTALALVSAPVAVKTKGAASSKRRAVRTTPGKRI